MDALNGFALQEDPSAIATWYLPWCLLTFLVSVALSILLTPVMMEAAKKHNIVDRPDGDLKNHKEPVPYLGGLAIYIAFVVTLGLLLRNLENDVVLGLLSAGSMILILGLVDDFGALTAPVKFLGQFIAAFILYKSGIMIQIALLPDEVNAILTILWIVGICNAFNIIDIMDGLAGGVAAISAIFLFLMTVLKGNDPVLSIMTLALAGSILGFLRFNFRPAKIYMGDTGAMFIGLMLGALTMLVSYGNANPLTPLAPLFILGIPIFDTLFVMFHRFRRGRSVFRGSPDHFALRLKQWTGSVKKTVIIAYVAAGICGTGGFVLIYLPGTFWPAVLLGGFVLALILSAILISLTTPKKSDTP